MNNSNPFVPKGSLLEQQSIRRSRLKIGVFCVLTVSITGLIAMLIQGCHREVPPVDSGLALDSTNVPAMMDSTNVPFADSNSVPYYPPTMTNTPTSFVPPALPETVAGTEYIVVAGDTLGKIAKAHGVPLTALQAANPGVDSKHLKLKQKLTIPASTKSADMAPAAGVSGSVVVGGETYVVKSGDTLTTIAKKHGTTVKAIEAANNLTTTKIKVNQKLKIPAKAEPTPVVAPAVEPTTAATPAIPSGLPPAK